MIGEFLLRWSISEENIMSAVMRTGGTTEWQAGDDVQHEV